MNNFYTRPSLFCTKSEYNFQGQLLTENGWVGLLKWASVWVLTIVYNELFSCLLDTFCSFMIPIAKNNAKNAFILVICNWLEKTEQISF